VHRIGGTWHWKAVVPALHKATAVRSSTFSTTFLRLAITLDLSLALYARPEIRPRIAVQGCVLGPLCADHGSRRHSGDHRRGFPQVNLSIVGLAGLEPGTSSLSGIFAGCVQAARGLVGQVVADMSVTVVVRSVWHAGGTTHVGLGAADRGRQPGHQGVTGELSDP
jgi:hypothetical protein